MPAIGANGGSQRGARLPGARPAPVAPPRVIVQAPTAPPILVPHSPSTTYHPGAIQSHFSPSAPSHGSYSPAGLPPVSGSMNAFAAQQAHQTQVAKVLANFFGKSSSPVSLLSKTPAFAAPKLSNPFDVNPLAKGFQIGRTDMGVDASATPGTPILALNDSKVVGYNANWFRGQPYMALQVLSGPNKGKNWYVAEQIAGPNSRTLANGDALPAPGTVFKKGQPVARYASSGTAVETGWGSATPGQTLAAATSGYSEGQVTPAGQDFLQHVVQGGKAPSVQQQPGKPGLPQGSGQLLAMLPGGVRRATVRQYQQPGRPLAPAKPISSPAGLTVKGAPATPQQIQAANVLLGEAHKLGVSKDAAAAMIYAAIYESGLQQGGGYNSSGYGGVLAGGHAFSTSDSAGQARAFLLGDSAKGYQGGGAAAQLRSGASIPAAAVKTEVPSIWPDNAYAHESGYGSDAQAVAEARAWVDRYGGFGGGSSAPISGGSSVGPSYSGGAPVGGGAAPAASSGGGSAAATVAATAAGTPPGATTIDPLTGQPVTPQDTLAQRNLSILKQFLSGGTGSAWDTGTKAASGVGDIGGQDLGSLAFKSLQAIAGMKLTSPKKALA